ncbi:MAG: DNA-directed RNA polymerase subunit alpha [Candidatus Yanofskybacteria bacterium RIFCSPLOWO2_02_FULL_43_10]|uniref:DNA-directed RNA polymerase subunit alpha n=1 Tax=Candidatus Yanofskybacteria bacterium RIFCSPLOWO2_12_FULL_43_11b TaxID=1802710 RepID=A0A1F8H7A2_9BACT|nr:MAG: DNA-directed RNA polymerase subunit alpha [Candidatus Yanofskybacteria bacterium RIFCSPHIGHO2_01_FULL_43_32]OGN11947.1 MAG: DNA-directed RNA polymerase subunit alpha [Candidatus Yanofskybacteria bacterium RIFCSPHIGHO2_02_FULL_43_12]OGN17307.1 MAG: DNA-directed RNA polymerase subunit alpha [Candidatus Yanofskybacteria bacterium RIFCSPHIGHO2_12_FULL_43_11]OGN24358.1 MAG: DNA-directed RNA polymerase subunit alpha [Candidatus Yanofskybacteria bacterium RIFCSPLOWO2_01_FULL_43_46]OGN29433.1 M
MIQIPEQIKVLSKEGSKTTFEISPLMPGYGATIANPLRRVLLSSLEGAAITSVKIKGVDHEFSSISGVLEDVVEVILNIKKIRFKLHGDGPVKLTLDVKGEKTVTAADIKLTSDIELINEDQHIATITDKKMGLSMELEVEKGVGYVPVEQRQKEKLAIGVIAVDAIFSPVKLVNFKIENVRVGQRIDFNKVVMEIETDGSIEPEEAMKKASEILVDHFKLISDVKTEEKTAKPKKTKATAKKKSK